MDLSADRWSAFEAAAIPGTIALHADAIDALSSDDRVLDFGCGRGRACLELARCGHAHVTGVDINAAAVAHARRQAGEAGLDPAPRFVAADVRCLPFAAGAFTFGMMQALLTTLAAPRDRAAVLAEARCVLVPGRRLYLAVFAQTWDDPQYRARYLEGERLTGERGTFAAPNPQTGQIDYFAHHYTEDELADLLAGADFRVERFRRDTFTTRTGNRAGGLVVLARAGG